MDKRTIEVKELKQIQIDILDNVAAFCNDNNLTYFLSYGTLLGAIRHNGYIPWDDDIDIAMPRPDYNWFVQNYNKIESNYKVHHYSLDKTYHIPFAKVCDERTSMWEYMYKESDFGVYIDVFPLDGSPQHNFFRIINKCLYRFLNTKKAILDNKRSLKKNIIMGLGKMLLMPIPANSIVKWMDFLGSRYDYNSSENVGLNILNEKEIIDKNLLSKTINHVFEDRSYKIPVGYDEYLKILFGDYMTPPPENKRESTHKFLAWWK